MAHNGQGYDFQMFLKYILENTKSDPNSWPMSHGL